MSPHFLRVPSHWFFLIPALVLRQTAAHAAVVLCTGPETTTYNPGIRNEPRSITFEGNGDMATCLSLGTNLTVTDVLSTGTANISCAANNNPAPSSLFLVWSNGSVSYAEGTTVANSKPAGQLVLVQDATIVSGTLQGAHILRALTSAQLDATACASDQGVTQVNGLDEILITGP
jgi:hypothetical protein